jgi:hypothetical protein
MKIIKKIYNFLMWPIRTHRMRKRLETLRQRDPFIYK